MKYNIQSFKEPFCLVEPGEILETWVWKDLQDVHVNSEHTKISIPVKDKCNLTVQQYAATYTKTASQNICRTGAHQFTKK